MVVAIAGRRLNVLLGAAALGGRGLGGHLGHCGGRAESSVTLHFRRSKVHASETGSDSIPLSAGGLLTTLLVSARGLLATGRLAAFGLSAIFFCRFSLRARVRSSSFYSDYRVNKEANSGGLKSSSIQLVFY